MARSFRHRDRLHRSDRITTPRTPTRSRAIVLDVGLACASVAAAPAAAQAVGPTGGARGCPVEDEHGNVSYVPAGTTYLLWHCGADGEWHFGTVTTNVVKHAPVAVAAPIATAPPILTR